MEKKHHASDPAEKPFTEKSGTVCSTYGTKWNGNAAADNGSLFAGNEYIVRRLTPRECERLQGFPDDYTDIPWKGNDHAPDGPRYKALGNSMAVPVMKWIAERIDWAKSHPITEDTHRPVYHEPDLF